MGIAKYNCCVIVVLSCSLKVEPLFFTIVILYKHTIIVVSFVSCSAHTYCVAAFLYTDCYWSFSTKLLTILCCTCPFAFSTCLSFPCLTRCGEPPQVNLSAPFTVTAEGLPACSTKGSTWSAGPPTTQSGEKQQGLLWAWSFAGTLVLQTSMCSSAVRFCDRDRSPSAYSPQFDGIHH